VYALICFRGILLLKQPKQSLSFWIGHYAYIKYIELSAWLTPARVRSLLVEGGARIELAMKFVSVCRNFQGLFGLLEQVCA
jgi:hypothetical protein